MARVTLCFLLIVGVIFTIEAAPQRFGQSSAQASASSSAGGRFRPEPSYAPVPPVSGGRGFGGNVGGNSGGRAFGPGYGASVGGRGVGAVPIPPSRGIGGGSGTSISIAKSVSINKGPGTGFNQASSSALARGK